MNKLTTINTIKKAAPLALLAVVMSGSAFAGPKGERPKGPKLSIDVYNACTAEGTSLNITTTVTPSDSKQSDGNASINNPVADPAFKGEICDTNKGGKQRCSQGFVPSGQTTTLYWSGSDPLAYSTVESIDLCALKPGLTKGDVVNAEVSVAVDYDTDNDGYADTTTTWVSACDDNPATHCGEYDENGEPIVCEKWDESIVKLTASCQ